MLFTREEVEKITNIVDLHTTVLIAQTLGKECLSIEDVALLQRNNVKIDLFLTKFPPYKQAWLFGRLTALLSEKQSKTITSSDFQKYLEKQQYIPATPLEREEYEISQRKTYEHIKGLGSRISTSIAQEISQQEMDRVLLSRQQKELAIKEKISEGILNRESIKKITSNIGNKLGEWNRDWSRIVETECQEINQLGRAQTIAKEHGINSRVYKQVFPGACKYCISLYMTNGIGSQPKIFTLAELINNGSNVGRKQKDWKAVLSYVHPFCRCELKYVPEGWIWNEEKKQFTPSKTFERKVERKSKIHITVGDKVFDV